MGIGEKSALSLMDQLLRSHAELCVTLRSAGRHILQEEKQRDGSLERIRQVLKRAENVRKAIQSPDALPETSKNALEDDLMGAALGPVSDHSPEHGIPPAPIRKNVSKRAHVNRPGSLRIIKFPAGLS